MKVGAASLFLDALHEQEGRRSSLKHCQARRAAIERALMEQAETLVTPTLHPPPNTPPIRWFAEWKGSVRKRALARHLRILSVGCLRQRAARWRCDRRGTQFYAHVRNRRTQKGFDRTFSQLGFAGGFGLSCEPQVGLRKGGFDHRLRLRAVRRFA
jgi:hypothetical protein